MAGLKLTRHVYRFVKTYSDSRKSRTARNYQNPMRDDLGVSFCQRSDVY